MSQLYSGYERVERDLYETPEWVTKVIAPYLPPHRPVWEPACGSGKMSRALVACGLPVTSSDIHLGEDFLKTTTSRADVIVTNPPYKLARRFIEHALQLAGPTGVVAMLLRTDYDHASTRQHLFSACPQFAGKVVLTKRIVWFDDGAPGANPSFNHAWYIWRGDHSGPPALSYYVADPKPRAKRTKKAENGRPLLAL
jgi:hypothetical protein